MQFTQSLLAKVLFAALIFFSFKTSFCNLPMDIKIAYWSTWDIPCGIAMYTHHNVKALQYYGYSVKIYPHFIKKNELLKQVITDKINILNIQYESAIMPSISNLIAIAKYLRSKNIKVLVTIHAEHPYLKNLLKHVDMFICHKPLRYIRDKKKILNLPMGVPVFETTKNYKQLKVELGFPSDCKIITTTGFMLTSKEIDKILPAFVPFLEKNRDYYIQLLTPFTERWPKICEAENRKIKEVIKNYKLEKQIIHITDFLPQQEFSERIAVSDVGYQWFKKHSGATSAAGKEFISTRVPLVIPESTHFHDLNNGVIKTNMSNVSEFVDTIIKVIENKKINEKLRNELEEEYNKYNYNEIIKIYIKFFNEILESN